MRAGGETVSILKEARNKVRGSFNTVLSELSSFSEMYPQMEAMTKSISDILDYSIPFLICGETSSGKSSLINMLLSYDLDSPYEFSKVGEHKVTNHFIVYELVSEDKPAYSMWDANDEELIARTEDIQSFVASIREWERNGTTRNGMEVKVRVPRSRHPSLEMQGTPVMLIDTPGFDDYVNFEHFMHFLQSTPYSPIAILL